MGYTAVMFFASIVLAPVAIVGGALLLSVARWFRLVPGGLGGALIGYPLIVCAGYGLLYLTATIDMLVLWPARLQQQYLGGHVAGPLRLVGFEAGGFQDPYEIWRYALQPAQAEALRRRCRWSEFQGVRTCSLYSASNERWFATVGLEGNQLEIMDGLH
jgi:hypothetical protein